MIENFETKNEALKSINTYWNDTIKFVRNLIIIGLTILIGVGLLWLAIKCFFKHRKNNNNNIVLSLSPSAPQALGIPSDIESIPMLTIATENSSEKITPKNNKRKLRTTKQNK